MTERGRPRRRRRTASSGSCRSTRRTAADRGASAVRLLHDAPRAAPAVADSRSATGPRSSYIGTRGVSVARRLRRRRPFSGDLRQLSVETLCTNRDLVLQMPIGIGTTDLSLDIAAPVQSIRVISGPSRPYAPLADGAVAWRAISHLSLNYLSLVQTTPEEGAAALRDLLELYAASADAERQAADRGDPVGARGPRRAPAAGAGPARLRPRPRDHGARSTSWRSRAEAHSCSDRCSSSSSRATCRSTRSPKPCCGPRAAGEINRWVPAMGREADALAFFAALAEAPYRYDFYQTLRRLECLYDDKPRWGEAPPSGRRTGAAGAGSGPVVRAGSARVVRGRRRQAAAAPGEAVRPVRAQRAAAAAPHRVRARAAASSRATRRSAGSSTSSIIGSSRCFYRAWAQAQPHVNRDRPKADRFAVYVGAFMGMAPPAFRDRDALPDLAKFFHVGALIRQVRNADGLTHILRQFFRRAGADRGVRRPLAVSGRRASGPRSVARGRGARRRRRARRAASGTASTSSAFVSAR